jgi:hypothetical protein
MPNVKIKDALKEPANLIKEISAEDGQDLMISTSSEKTVVLKQAVWRDEYVGGDWGNATGNATPTFGTYTIGGIAYRKMALDANDSRTNCFEIPHDMVLSQDAELQPEVHAHIRPTNNATGTVVLYLEPEWSKANTTETNPTIEPLPLAEMTATLTITNGSSNFPHYVVSFGKLPVNSYNIGDLIGFKVSRRTGQGTYTADIIIEKLALHVPVDTAGSRKNLRKMIWYALFFSVIGYAYSNIVLNDLGWRIKHFLLFNDNYPEWIRKPLGGCSICFTGQLTFWGSLALVEWTYTGLITLFGIVSINMIIVIFLNKTFENETYE